MAIYGIGATYDNEDVSQDFIDNNMACIGWSIDDAPSLYEILRGMKIGDIIYIKSAPIGQDIRVKGVGIITNNEIIETPELGSGVTVKWLWSGTEYLSKINDKYNVRNNTLYEEYNKEIQAIIINLIFKN